MNRKLRLRDSAAMLLNTVEMLCYSLLFLWGWKHYFSKFVPFHRGIYIVFLVYFVVLFLFLRIYNGFGIGSSDNFDIILSQILAILFADLFTYFELSLIAYQFLSVGHFLLIYAFQVILVILLVNLFDRFFHQKFDPIQCLYIYGHDDDTISVKLQKYQNKNFRIKEMMKFDQKLTPELLRKADESEEVIVCGIPHESQEQLALYCYEHMKRLIVEPDIYDVLMNRGKDLHLIDTLLFQLNHFGPSQIEKAVKRFFDIVFSSLGIIILSPLFLITALAVKLQDGGPVFYKQVRLTQYGRTFRIIKFRSMRVDAEANGKAVLAKEHDDRITPVGRFIRKCRLDELPQLFNILNGDMSIVGPRPERPEIAEQISEEVPDFKLRLMVKAGLTGYAQIYGKYNTTLHDKLLLDLQYIENFSILLDIKLFLMTFKIIFKKDSTEGVQE